MATQYPELPDLRTLPPLQPPPVLFTKQNDNFTFTGTIVLMETFHLTITLHRQNDKLILYKILIHHVPYQFDGYKPFGFDYQIDHTLYTNKNSDIVCMDKTVCKDQESGVSLPVMVRGDILSIGLVRLNIKEEITKFKEQMNQSFMINRITYKVGLRYDVQTIPTNTKTIKNPMILINGRTQGPQINLIFGSLQPINSSSQDENEIYRVQHDEGDIFKGSWPKEEQKYTITEFIDHAGGGISRKPFKKCTVTELREKARQRNINGRSSMNKQQLITALQAQRKK